MAENFYTILTSIGQAKIANSQVTGQKVNLAEIAAGDGNGSYYNPVQSQTGLRKEVWRGNISAVQIDEENPNWIVIEGVIPSSAGGFFVREVGVFDEEGDLIAIGKYPETYKPVAAEGSAKDLYIRMIIEVTNASAVQLKIDPSVIIASRKYVDGKVAPVEQKANQNEANILQVSNSLAAHLNENVQADQPHGIVIEEGEWTPYYQPLMGEFGNIEYSEQYGYYYRNNKFVYVFGYLSVNGFTFDKGNANGGLRIAGLPFNPARAIYFTASRFFRWGTNDETIGINFRAEHSYLIIKKIVKPNFFYTGVPDDNIYVDDMLLADNTHLNHIAFSGIYTI